MQDMQPITKNLSRRRLNPCHYVLSGTYFLFTNLKLKKKCFNALSLSSSFKHLNWSNMYKTLTQKCAERNKIKKKRAKSKLKKVKGWLYFEAFCMQHNAIYYINITCPIPSKKIYIEAVL